MNSVDEARFHGDEASASRETPRLRVEGVSKSFPGVRALNQVSFEVWPGEVHALVGENGAGKSTLMRLIAGVETPDEGQIFLDGKPLVNLDEHQASKLGIGMVHQERSLVPHLSVAENVFAARQPTNWAGAINWKQMHKRTRELLQELQVEIDPTRLAGELSPAQQQMVEIAKGLSLNLRLLILDEPTAALTLTETRHLFQVIHHLCEQGVAIVYISHRLAEIFEIARHITVLKDGCVTGTPPVKSTNEAELMRLMVGRDLSFTPDPRRVPADAPVVLQLEDVVSLETVKQASLTVRAGEIVCLAGLVGAGRTELCETIFGARSLDRGRIVLDGREMRFKHPRAACQAGIAMVPEDRKDTGLFLEKSIVENIAAANLQAVSQGFTISKRSSKALAQTYIKDLRIATPTADQLIVNLSGGNQQKVLLAKWFARKPRLLIVDEPTRGVDVGARADIYQVLRTFAESGVALLIVSSDLPEVLALAQRIVVMSEGRTVGEMDASVATETAILELASPASNHRTPKKGDFAE